MLPLLLQNPINGTKEDLCIVVAALQIEQNAVLGLGHQFLCFLGFVRVLCASR